MIFILNGRQMDVAAQPDETLLWVLREKLKLTGTKYGCGMAMCGSCTVHLDGQAIRSCVTRMQVVEGKRITTIEGQPTRAQIVQAMNGNLCRCGTYGRIVRAVERAARGEA